MKLFLLIILIALLVTLALVIIHEIIGKPVEIQSVFQGKTSDRLFICLAGAGACGAEPFNAIRDRVLLEYGDVLYIKYPEKWLSFRKSKNALAEIIKIHRHDYQEICMVANSLGCKIVIAAEARVYREIKDFEVTNYFFSPTFKLSDVMIFSDFKNFKSKYTAKVPARDKIPADPNWDMPSQAFVDLNTAKYKTLIASQFLATTINVAPDLKEAKIRTIIFATHEDWLINSEVTLRHFLKNISSNLKVSWVPLNTHCELLQEAHIYCDALEPLISKK